MMTRFGPAWCALRLSIVMPLLVAGSLEPQAHVTIDNAQSQRGSFKARFNVTHGCDGSPTNEVRITIPEGVIGVKPMPKPGWSLATTRGQYAKSYDYFHGKQVAEGVRSVTWSGGKLLNEHVDEFVLSIYVTDALKPGDIVHFPVEQICDAGKLLWVEKPAAGQDAHTLKAPAPGIKILPANDDRKSSH